MPLELTDQEQKAKIWAELDKADGQPPAPVEPPPAQKEPAEEPPAADPAPADQADAQKVADPFDGWPETAKHEVLGMRGQMEHLALRLRNAEGHIGGLNKQVKQQLAAKPAQAKDEGGDVPTQAQLREAKKDPEAMRRLKDDYPDFGAAMEGALKEELDARFAQLKAELPGQPQQDAFVTREELAARDAHLSIEQRHPGWQNEVKTPAFHGWLTSQPREVQLLAQSADVGDAVRLLDLRKEASMKRQQSDPNTQRQASAAAIPAGRAGQFRAKPVEEMSKAEYWKYLDSVDAQKG